MKAVVVHRSVRMTAFFKFEVCEYILQLEGVKHQIILSLPKSEAEFQKGDVIELSVKKVSTPKETAK